HRLPRSQNRRQPLMHLDQAYLTLALHGASPAPPECAMPHHERKFMFRRQGQKGISLRLGCRYLTAAVMEEDCPVPGCCQAMRMGEGLSEGQCLLTPLHRLRWIAQAPQGEGRDGKAPHPRGLSMVQRLSLLHGRINEGDPLPQVSPGSGVFTHVEQGSPQRFVGL